MTITLNADYDVTLSTALLGYVGETNARPVSVEGMEIDGADRYVLTIDYGDGTVYEVDITGGQWTPTADILRSAQTVSCQIAATKLSGDEYVLVKKSRMFRLRIGAAIGDNAVPSPSVATDALDRIDAIGKQAHADMQTAVTAADTATTAANNATKSATNAGLSADTAEQAAERAETAKTAVETSATQAETAMQGAETARAEAVKSQNSAKVSAVQASTAAQQTTADKNITAGYAKTSKTNADSTAVDRQAVQTLAEQVTADKANVAENATKVAEDRAAAETAAQTAQAVADSLPDDYTTAVGKIAENTAEIANVKLTDKELQRRVNALYDLGNGVTHQFETDSETAYAKTVPTGAKLMSVKSVGGRSIVFNQFAKNKPFDSRNGITTSTDGNYSVLDGTATNAITAKGWWGLKLDEFSPTNGHKYLFCSKIISGTVNPANGCTIGTAIQKQIVGKSFIFEMSDKHWDSNWLSAIYSDKDTVFNKLKISVMLIDLTLMFGSGNEPSTVEEFEKIFPNDYYPYNAGEIVSAGTEEVVVGDTAHPIPEAIRNLPGYGWSAGTVRNYVDYENKRYVQCVNSVDLGTENWRMYKDGDYTPFFYLNAVSDIRGGTSNFLCPKYQYVKIGVTDSASGLYVLENTTVRVRDTAYTDVATFKQAMQGVMLYYELATPIITDISTLVDDDFLRNLTVEAGGSITFKNSNDSYRIPVPSEEEYVVKLSEIGGSV
ncbi:hypothetical protein [Ruminococcus sp. AM31-15AC]|uniref:hypothetical protein n=1 Tax=Ruminococcus sp. AM31-15AC TaxID=2293202 RepID=UPI000E4FF90A|nr:hypothetical protein DW793_05730 [Ruminococcus sp. AM31-15AC]